MAPWIRILVLAMVACLFPASVESIVRHYKFNRGVPYPFPKPDKEEIVILGEWWKSDTEDVINEALKSGLAPNVSDSHTINGHPGQAPNCPSQASPFMDAPIAVDNTTATAILNYIGSQTTVSTTLIAPPPKNATPVASNFTNALRSLNSKEYPASVPLKIDHNLLFTVSLGINPCSACPNGSRVVAGINNITFVMPSVALLNAHFFNMKGVFTDDFPANPPIQKLPSKVIIGDGKVHKLVQQLYLKQNCTKQGMRKHMESDDM
ncbi:Laccase-4 [Tripterygium wilfordii]|uniref:Laccase-4 n=1 Tax=Tripterygium wilfordii TaxID=458696 RepID=A0A7J7DDS9_TRIWF|nr:Laccase-4 [Tripterygium wilfordii]